jgi:hypothetical protein
MMKRPFKNKWSHDHNNTEGQALLKRNCKNRGVLKGAYQEEDGPL